MCGNFLYFLLSFAVRLKLTLNTHTHTHTEQRALYFHFPPFGASSRNCSAVQCIVMGEADIQHWLRADLEGSSGAWLLMDVGGRPGPPRGAFISLHCRD